MDKTISVLIVDDSKVARELLKHIIESDPIFEVIGMVNSGEEALRFLEKETPSVITMDIFMPNLDGFEVTRHIMETKPIPIVIISGSYNAKNDQIKSFNAIEAGALSILEKPVGVDDHNFEVKALEIRDTLKKVSEIKLIKRRFKPKPESIQKSKTYLVEEPLPEKMYERFEAVAIGASLGGPPAISQILSKLPFDFPIPIFIVQHIAAGFTEGLVNWLQNHSYLQIKLAHHNEKAEGGKVYIAPDHCQMEIKKGGIISLDERQDNKMILQPSVSRLFKSMAEVYGSKGIGILLTGMGKDGAKELLEMSNKGAFTIAQDEATCVMFGMPKEAIALNAAKQILSLDQIVNCLQKLLENKAYK